MITDDAALEFAAVAHALRHHHAVLDHARRRVAAIPHQPVEVRDVHEQRVALLHPMLLLERILLRRIVLDIDARQAPLRVGEKVEAVVVPLRLVLKQDDVELTATALRSPAFHARSPRRQRAGLARVSGRIAGPRDEIEVVRRLAQVVQIIAVDMPGEHAQAPGISRGHEEAPPRGVANATSSTLGTLTFSAHSWPIRTFAERTRRHAGQSASTR